MRLIVAAAALVLLAGCKTRTDYGPCIGAFDDKDPALTYRVSIWNAAMAVVFVEMVIPPIYVVAEATLCPTGRKPPTKATP
jgi:hypothetical protein